MTSDIIHIIASYDISDPKRLAKVARVMKNYGERVLKSVFECNLDEKRFEDMKAKVDEIIEPIEDTVRYYTLCEKCIKDVDHSGKGEEFQEEKTMSCFSKRTCANPVPKQAFSNLLKSQGDSNTSIHGSRKMEFMCDSEKLPPNGRSRIAVRKVSTLGFPMGSRKATIFALNTLQKGGPQLETLT